MSDLLDATFSALLADARDQDADLADARVRFTELGLVQELAALDDAEREALASPGQPDRSG